MSTNASDHQEVTFGAVVNPINTNAVGQGNTYLTPNTPSSPFYTLPSAQPSLQSLSEKKEANIAVHETDLEAGRQNSRQLTPLTSYSGLDLSAARTGATNISTNECAMWPTKQMLKEQRKAQKMEKQEKRCCGPAKIKWDSMTKKQRLWIRIFIFLTIVALAVGLGVGISRAVNGGVYAGKGQSHAIPSSP